MQLPPFDAFDADVLRLMTAALDTAVAKYYGSSVDDDLRRAMARRVVFAAGHGDRDLDILARAALNPAHALADLRLPTPHRSSA
jgi:hypothetical protein